MIEYIDMPDEWGEVKRSARNTVSKDGEGMYPPPAWKKSILLAEHSPIRKLRATWRWKGLKSWVSVHFVRHKYGIEHWVSTQRSDRTGIPRDKLPQDSKVDHMCEANAQALINISRKRLCNQAAPETREAWAATTLTAAASGASTRTAKRALSGTEVQHDRHHGDVDLRGGGGAAAQGAGVLRGRGGQGRCIRSSTR